MAFPLFHLPNDALLNVLKSMDCLQLITFSLLSKKFKKLVISLKLKVNELILFTTRFFEIILSFRDESLLRFCLYIVEENESPLKLGTPRDITIEGMRWTNSMNVEELIDHFGTIFHTDEVILEFDTNADRYDLESIHTIVQDVYQVRLAGGDHEFNQKVLKMFRPDRVYFFQNTLENGRISERILIENLVDIGLDSSAVRLTLNDLLLMNSLEITISHLTLTGKEINRFMKLWMRGSNPRLRVFQVRLSTDDAAHLDAIWEGVKYQDIPLHEKRHFKLPGGITTMEGGRDIHRMDGTTATCFFPFSDGFVTFELIVWHSHCKVD